jgi:hypothetical protein
VFFFEAGRIHRRDAESAEEIKKGEQDEDEDQDYENE